MMISAECFLERCTPIVKISSDSIQNTGDAGTLLATLSQASAVLVAIIGGLLVSRLVAISSEKDGLRRLLLAAKGRVLHIESDLSEASEIRLDRARSDLYDTAVEDFIAEPCPDLDKIINDSLRRGTTVDELKPYALKLQERTKSAQTAIQDHLKRNDTNGLEFEELLERGLTFNDDDQDLHERVFTQLRKKLRSDPYGYGLVDFPVSVEYVTSAREIRERRRDEELRSESDLKTQLKAALNERDRLSEELERIGKPVGVASAVWMLGILSVLGILIPVVVMAFEPVVLATWMKVTLISCFVAGLLAILGYILWFWRKISLSED